MTNQPTDPRIVELLDWQFTTGRPLPMAITAILAHEDAGRVVDLVTGDLMEEEKPTTSVSTIPGCGYSKTITVELEPEDVCVACGTMPTIGLWASCDGCLRPVCGRCAHQVHDGHFCGNCAPGRGA
ncbi:MAG TPA: hypothetical protein PKC18_12470 [Lacipirellulaceae bacterium]|nr:hypothetical protein [Lacipirellulaceae bacterium]